MFRLTSSVDSSKLECPDFSAWNETNEVFLKILPHCPMREKQGPLFDQPTGPDVHEELQGSDSRRYI